METSEVVPSGIKARYVIWFKDGYYYRADTKLLNTICSKQRSDLINKITFIKSEGGAEYWF